MSERKQAKSYTAEFKESAVKLAVESKRPLAQTARELGVSKDTLYGWVRQYHGQPQVSQELVASEPVYEELKRLRREVSILKEERDILKNYPRAALRPAPVVSETPWRPTIDMSSGAVAVRFLVV
jgi:transposase